MEDQRRFCFPPKRPADQPTAGAGDGFLPAASPIPGNESSVYRTVDNLFRLGATVLYSRIANVHVRGHDHRGLAQQRLLEQRVDQPLAHERGGLRAAGAASAAGRSEVDGAAQGPLPDAGSL